ncbi:MAG: ATP-binding domain-containing protein, partial [Bacteroidales bacterium]|nr:ATP-binding domain-containing protein [Bacteroidales bacterium]
LKMNLQLNNDAFAVLYRTNAQSRAIEEALRKANIPYRIYGGLSFYKRKEIKDLAAYFRLVVNPMDGDALKRIINYPTRGIGDTTMDKAERISLEQGIPLWEVISNPHRYSLDIRGNTLAKMDAFVNMILKFHHQVKTRSAYELAKDIKHASGILRELEEDKTPEGVARVDNIEELLNAISDFAENDQVIPGIDDDESVGMRTLDVFLQDIALFTDADEKDDGTPKVALMTIHAAKGLEFPFVFVSGMEENLFPNIQALNSRSELEEERRLFYVAITRAQKRLFLSFALTRYVHGQLNYCEPSRFLEEIDEKFIEMPRKVKMGRDEPAARFVSSLQVQSASAKVIPSTDPSKLKKMNSALSAVGNPGSDELIRTLQVGMQVHHERFGEGKVISLEGEGPNRKATIFFPGVGQKQLLLKFAKLKII